MARITKIKVSSLDLQSLFAPGFKLDNSGKVALGDEWLLHTPGLINGSNINFQMPSEIKVVGGVLFVHFFVNGVQVPDSRLSLDPNQSTIIQYDNSNYFEIDQTDLVEIWYVKA